MAEAVVVSQRSRAPADGIRNCNWRLAAVATALAALSRSLVIALGLAIPVSTSATEAILLALLVCWLLSGDYAGKLATIRGNRVAVLALAMFGVYAIGVLYSSAAWSSAADALLQYRKLLYLAVFLTVFRDARVRRYGIVGFQIGMVVTLGASLLMSWGLVQTKWGGPTDCAVFKNHIAQNVLMAFFVAVLAGGAYRSRRLRWLYVGLMLLAVYNVLFMVGGRTGYLILFAMFGLLMFRRMGFRGLALGAGLLACLVAGAYGCSSGFRERVNLAAREASDYYHFQRDTVDSSIGQRLLFYRSSLAIAMQNPLFGMGTGSFKVEFQRLPENQGKHPTADPHSDYFNVLIQTGLVGLALFVYWLYVQWKESDRLPPELSFLARALIVTLVVGGLFNSFISTHTEGWLFCYFAALCYAARDDPCCRNNEPKV